MQASVTHRICGLGELADIPLRSARRIVSILDPGTSAPPELAGLPDVLTLRFHDVIVEGTAYVAPTRDDIATLLAFDREHDPADALVIHCTAGISRSTAAFVALLAQRQRGDEAALFAHLRRVRPEAWPNSRIVALADELLARDGALTAALRDHYKHQLRTYPYLGRMMIGLGREAEVPFDRLRPADTPSGG